MVRREPQFGNQMDAAADETGSIAPKPSGGSLSPLEAHADFLLALIADHPDLTLDEIVAAMRKRRIPGSRSAVWRFFERHNISFKKKPAGGGGVGGLGALGGERGFLFRFSRRRSS